MQIDISNYLSKFTVRESPRLDLKDNNGNEYVDDFWKLVNQLICPICLCRIKVALNGDLSCNSKKHLGITKKRLFIRAEKFNVNN